MRTKRIEYNCIHIFVNHIVTDTGTIIRRQVIGYMPIRLSIISPWHLYYRYHMVNVSTRACIRETWDLNHKTFDLFEVEKAIV